MRLVVMLVAAAAPMTLAQSGIVPNWIDPKFDPCTDMYAFACGGFMQTATIPPDRSSWGAIEIVVKAGTAMNPGKPCSVW